MLESRWNHIMTMHLVKGTYLPNRSKKKLKLTKTKLRELELDWRKHTKDMKRSGSHELIYKTLDDYINYRFGFTKRIKEDFKPYKPKAEYRRETAHYPSVSTPTQSMTFSGNPTAKREPLRYTGSLIKGISTMHKSNMVPIINSTEAKDHANMRR